MEKKTWFEKYMISEKHDYKNMTIKHNRGKILSEKYMVIVLRHFYSL